MKEAMLNILLVVPGILLAFTFHEYAHAIVAYKLGDSTPKFQGRLTLNPFAHIDPIGFLMILIVHFGWAKPVETNPRAFKNYYKDDLKVSLAGPLANLLLAFIFVIIEGLFLRSASKLPIDYNLLTILLRILDATIRINCMLVIFNLLPLPGLDGFHIFRDLFPKAYYNVSGAIYNYQMLILIIFVATPISNYVVGIPATSLYNVLIKVTSLFV